MSFHTSLRAGQFGEIVFYQAHEGTLKREDGRKRDFTCAVTGAGIELKTDFYSMEATPNFFIERWSDKDKQKPGGPWQAMENGTHHFIYFFAPNLTYFKFETAPLIEALELILPTLQPMEVSNKSWTTVGYRVPRELLTALATQVRLTVGLAA